MVLLKDVVCCVMLCNVQRLQKMVKVYPKNATQSRMPEMNSEVLLARHFEFVLLFKA